MATKKKVQKSTKARATAKPKNATTKKQSRPTIKASAKKQPPKKSSKPRTAPLSKAAAAGAGRGMQTRYSGATHREEADELELEAPELDLDADDSGEEIPEDLLPPEYGGEN